MKSRVLILGAGFGGLELATLLSDALGPDADVTVIDRRDHFVFGYSRIDVMFGKTTLDGVQLSYETFDRPGVRLGLRHGGYCIGCCWGLMMVLYVAGVMSVSAIAVLSEIVAIEKLAPGGEAFSRLGGGLLIIWGLWLIIAKNGGHLAAI